MQLRLWPLLRSIYIMGYYDTNFVILYVLLNGYIDLDSFYIFLDIYTHTHTHTYEGSYLHVLVIFLSFKLAL